MASPPSHPKRVTRAVGRQTDINATLRGPMNDDFDPRILNTSTAWQLWHSDTFDREAPVSLQAAGINIVQGFYELWHYTLKEGILDNGNASFSRFHLTWENAPVARVDVFVNPFGNPALLKLRHWTRLMSEDQEGEGRGIAQTAEAKNDALLLRLAQLHYEFLQKSLRWKASAIDWSAEARELIEHIELLSDPKEL